MNNYEVICYELASNLVTEGVVEDCAVGNIGKHQWLLDSNEWFPLPVIAESLYESLLEDRCVFNLSSETIHLLKEYLNES